MKPTSISQFIDHHYRHFNAAAMKDAAHAYRALEGEDLDTVVLVGPSHYVGFDGVAIYDRGGFETPLGVSEIDEDLAAALISAPLWVCLGFWFGSNIQEAARHASKFSHYILAASLLVTAIVIFRWRRQRARESAAIARPPSVHRKDPSSRRLRYSWLKLPDSLIWAAALRTCGRSSGWIRLSQKPGSLTSSLAE